MENSFCCWHDGTSHSAATRKSCERLMWLASSLAMLAAATATEIATATATATSATATPATAVNSLPLSGFPRLPSSVYAK